MHTNDLHAHLVPFKSGKPVCDYNEKDCQGGFARLLSFINTYRKKYPDAILLDGGDRFSGTFFYTINKGNDIIHLMNEMNYDAVTLGNHDFDDGLPEIQKMINQINTAVISANVIFPEDLQKKIEPAVILKRKGIKIGIIGILTPDIKTETKGGKEIKLKPLLQTIQFQVDLLKKSGVKIIVLLSHTGDQTETQLAKEISDIDIIIGAHSHTKKFEKIIGKNNQPVLISSAGYGGQTIGAFSVLFNRLGHVVGFKNEAKSVDQTIQPNIVMQKEIDDIILQVNQVIRKPVTFSEKPIDIKKAEIRKTPEYESCLDECYIGEVLTDALLKTESSADFAFINSGAIRAGLPQGDIRVQDLMEAFPFDSSVVLVSMTGAEIKEYLSHGLHTFTGKRANGMIQCAGLSYTYRDFTQPITLQTLHGNLDEQKTYKVLLPDFLAKGGDGFPVLPILKETAPSLRKAVIREMQKSDYKIPSFEQRIQKTEN